MSPRAGQQLIRKVKAAKENHPRNCGPPSPQHRTHTTQDDAHTSAVHWWWCFPQLSIAEGNMDSSFCLVNIRSKSVR